MTGIEKIIDAISKGRTDYVYTLIKFDNWHELAAKDAVNVYQWLIYYNDLTALKTLLHFGGNLDCINLDEELGNASFFGHWKICEFLIGRGADVNSRVRESGESCLHNALCKAGRPYYIYTLRILLENGADPNVKTISGKESGAFMRDVRTLGETPLHRAAAYADIASIELLLNYGANKQARDVNGHSPLSWASMHLRPGNILQLLSFNDHRISDKHCELNKSDHGNNWGNSMDWNLYGSYLRENKDEDGLD